MRRLVSLLLLLLAPLPALAQPEKKDAPLFKPYVMLIRDFTLEDAAGQKVSVQKVLISNGVGTLRLTADISSTKCTFRTATIMDCGLIRRTRSA